MPRIEEAWTFDRATLAGCIHAVRPGEDRTLCGRDLDPHGQQTGKKFQYAAVLACKKCAPKSLEGIERRFLSHVRKSEGCWLWMGSLTQGYGYFRVGDGKRLRAHRVAYEMFVGPIPEGLTIDHLCRNRACVNPEHMEPVEQRTNILRGFAPSALNARRTHCQRGREFTPENTYVTPTGERRCRTCTRARQRRYADAK